MPAIDIFVDADQTPVNQRSSAYQWDDFQGSSGDLNWVLTGTGATTAQLAAPGVGENFPGMVQVITDATNGHDATYQRADFYESRLSLFEWVFQPNQVGSVLYRLGAFSSLSAPASGIGVEYNTGSGDTALSLVKYIASVRTVGATIAINTTHRYRLAWSRTGSGAGTLTINDLDAATSQTYAVTGLAASAQWNMGAYIKNLAASSNFLNLDWFLAALVGMSR